MTNYQIEAEFVDKSTGSAIPQSITVEAETELEAQSRAASFFWASYYVGDIEIQDPDLRIFSVQKAE